MQVAIIDYGSGNLRSAAKSFERAAEATGHKVLVTSKATDLAASTHIVLPGVGAFADCMRGLLALSGMVEAMNQQVIANQKPFLGICVGMQMMMEKGFEHGEHQGLGWIKGVVRAITPPDASYKIPHMGWNELSLVQSSHPLLKGLRGGDHAYFVHSYHADCASQQDLLATTEYGTPLAAVIGRGNIMGTQFHPEKSQATGLRLIENFLRI